MSNPIEQNVAGTTTLMLLLSLVVLATAGCVDIAPPAASADVGTQPDLSAPGLTLHTVIANVSQASASPPAAGLAASADEFGLDDHADFSGDKTRVVFLHGLHSPFGMALAMSRMPTPP